MSAHLREVVVVGGGISGLTAAWYLKKAGVDVCLLEADPIVGGCTRTERRDGFLLEKGPFNVIVRDPAFEALLDDVSNEVTVVTATRSARRRYIYRGGRLWPVPTNPLTLATTRLLSVRSRCRLLAGLLLSPRGCTSEETIEQAAVRRFGQSTTDTIVSAVVAGIFAGDIRRLSLKACFPPVSRIDSKVRSLLGYGLTSALRSLRRKGGRRERRWRGLVSIDEGLGAITTALGRRLSKNLLCSSRVEGIRATGGGYEVNYVDAGSVAHTLQCRHLLVATPATTASRLLRPLLSEAAAIVDSIECASLVVLNLGFRRTDVGHPMDGFGFLVPHDEPDFPLMGVLWADSVFPHLAPADRRLIRVFIGGARDPEAVMRTDDELLASAMDALRRLLQLSGEPLLVDVCRHRAAIPQYHLGHPDKIERLRDIIATQPGLHLIGNYLEGISLNDCVRLAANVARRLC